MYKIYYQLKNYEVRIMKKTIYLTLALSLFINPSALAQSPIPTFDKEAVTAHPYNRTGEQDVIVDKTNQDVYSSGNTGTDEEPAFYVRRINLTGYSLPDKNGGLQKILQSYSHRSVKIAELNELTEKITAYAKDCGYTVAQAVVPPQKITDGQLEIRVYVAKYDEIRLTENTSDIAASVLEKYLHNLKQGETMTDRNLERTLNNLNDLPGVTARAVLRPGDETGATSVDVQVEKRPVWNNYIFADNGGGYYSGRYRYGFNTEINNPGHNGDKLTFSGMISSHDVKNYSIRYEAPVGYDGTRIGLAYNRSEYELHTNAFYNSLGKSQGISIYGLTPLYRDKMNRLTAIYGYDHRKIEDSYRFRVLNLPEIGVDKDADVWHAGVSGSQYYPNEFLQYDLIYWNGDIDTNGGAYYDGTYHKLTGSMLKIWYDGPWNYRIYMQGQMGNRALDGSEQFYLGGMNGVRAYGSSDGYGDSGWLSTFEIRRQTGIEGLEAAAFFDTGYADNKAANYKEHLSGWGLGLRYSKQNDWYAQLDWARKIDGRRDWTEPHDSDNRLWLQVYKMY